MVSEDDLFDDEKSKDEEEDGELAEYSPKSEFSKPKIVGSSVQKCLEHRSVELKEGYYNYKIDNSGNTIKIWVADSRKVYCSSVTALMYLLRPEIIKHINTKKRLIELAKDEEAIFTKYSYTEKKKEMIKGRLMLVDTDREYIPEFDASVIVIDFNKINVGVRVNGGWNANVSAYWNEMVELSDEIFAVLNELIDSINYFKQGREY